MTFRKHAKSKRMRPKGAFQWGTEVNRARTHIIGRVAVDLAGGESQCADLNVQSASVLKQQGARIVTRVMVNFKKASIQLQVPKLVIFSGALK